MKRFTHRFPWSAPASTNGDLKEQRKRECSMSYYLDSRRMKTTLTGAIVGNRAAGVRGIQWSASWQGQQALWSDAFSRSRDAVAVFASTWAHHRRARPVSHALMQATWLLTPPTISLMLNLLTATTLERGLLWESNFTSYSRYMYLSELYYWIFWKNTLLIYVKKKKLLINVVESHFSGTWRYFQKKEDAPISFWINEYLVIVIFLRIYNSKSLRLRS